MEQHTILIRKFDDYARISQYDPLSGQHKELPQNGTPPNKITTRGFYTYVTDGVVGIYSSSEGPVCFHNDQQYRLEHSAWNVEIGLVETADGNVEQECTLFCNDQQQFSVSYAPPLSDKRDNWMDREEDIDFFVWLKSKEGNPFFTKYNTLV